MSGSLRMKCWLWIIEEWIYFCPFLHLAHLQVLCGSEYLPEPWLWTYIQEKIKHSLAYLNLQSEWRSKFHDINQAITIGIRWKIRDMDFECFRHSRRSKDSPLNACSPEPEGQGNVEQVGARAGIRPSKGRRLEIWMGLMEKLRALSCPACPSVRCALTAPDQDQTPTSTATQAAAVRFSTHCATRGTPT